MDEALSRRARSRGGLLLTGEAAGLRPGERRGLVVVQPGVLAAATQPVDAALTVAALDLLERGHAYCGATALWLYGLAPAPEVVEVGVPARRQVVLRPPVRVRRLAPPLLHGTRWREGHEVVSLETALVQTAESVPRADLLAVLEQVLRRRLTTASRLQAACRRGVAGSAALRQCLRVLVDGSLEVHVRRLSGALTEAGVRDLTAEAPLRSSRGELAYGDLLHAPSRNLLEVDGWQTHAGRVQFVADRRRDRWVRRELGIVTTRIAASEVEHDLPGVVAELLPLLRRR